MESPGFDEDLGFLEGVEDFSIQELVAQPRIEALDVAVLPRRTGLDEGGAVISGEARIVERTSGRAP